MAVIAVIFPVFILVFIGYLASYTGILKRGDVAGMPVGISAYIFADNYQLGIAALSTAVLLSTILAIFSQSFWLLFLT